MFHALQQGTSNESTMTLQEKLSSLLISLSFFSPSRKLLLIIKHNDNMVYKNFSIAFCVLFLLPTIQSSLLDYLGLSGKNSGPKGPTPEGGECSYWDRWDPYFSSYNSDDLVGFHKTIPRGGYAKVYNDMNNKSVSVRIVAEGPLADGRVMELSPAAFEQVSKLTEVVFPCTVVASSTYSTGTVGVGHVGGAGGERYQVGGSGNYKQKYGPVNSQY